MTYTAGSRKLPSRPSPASRVSMDAEKMRKNARLDDPRDVSVSTDVSKPPAPSAQCFLDSRYSELAHVLELERQSST